MGSVIHAELELTACSGELWLNGVPLPGLPMRRPTFEMSVCVDHLLVTGMNDLELWVDVDGTRPSESHTPRTSPPNPAAVAVARLVAYDPGVLASPENGKVLATFEYRGAADTSTEAPRVRRLSVDLGRSFGPWAWEKAPPLALDDLTLREAAAVVREVHAALFGGDPQRVFDLVRLRWEEMDRAYPGRDDAADRRSHAAWIAELASDPRRRVPLDPARHDFRLVAGGRMIECIDADFFPSIRIAQEVEPGAGEWIAAPYPLSLARVGPRLTVVR
jgi:hypothetical protein